MTAGKKQVVTLIQSMSAEKIVNLCADKKNSRLYSGAFNSGHVLHNEKNCISFE